MESVAPGTLEERILTTIGSDGPLKAKDIAEKLHHDRAEVNRALYGVLQGRVRQDGAFRWILTGNSEPGPGKESRASAETRIEQPPMTEDAAPKCPECDAPMRQRTARVGRNAGNTFWGCSRFPTCKGTRDIGTPHDESGIESPRNETVQAAEAVNSFPVAWREAKARISYRTEYVPIGACSSLTGEKVEADDAIKHALAHTVLLSRIGERPAGSVTERVRGILAVAEKILLRGYCPLVSPGVERRALEAAGLAGEVTDLAPEGMELGFEWHGRAPVVQLGPLIHRAEFLGCEDLALDDGHGAGLADSEHELMFVEWLAEQDPSLPQWLLPQVPMDNLLSNTPESADGRRVDFALCHPLLESSLVIEIDGPDHTHQTDAARDRALKAAGIRVVRVTNAEVEAGAGPALSALRRLIAPAMATGRSRETPVSRFALECAWAAKVQLALVRCMQSGWLPSGMEEWSVAISTPFDASADAVLDLLLLIDAIETIYGTGLLPVRVNVAVGDSHVQYEREEKGWQRVDGSDGGRTELVDASIALEPLQGPFARYPGDDVDVIVRPAPVPGTLAVGHPGGNTTVLNVEASLDDAQAALTQALQWIFRKQQFRDGQSAAVYNALSGVDSIVLLPTGGGKSIIYQLSGLLMPGVTLVIDPIVALIEDQVRGMRIYGIDRAVGISSAVGSAAERNRLLAAAERGEHLFVLVAPERMQSPQFRDTLRALSQVSRVNLAVIDEAHCVSEWGHDFRPAYLNLGRNLRRLAQVDGRAPTLLALTGTASRAVLRDMVADLEIDPGNRGTVIRPASFDRKEIRFQIVYTSNRDRLADLRGLMMRMPGEFGRPASDFWMSAGRRSHTGIVFTPRTRGRGDGVLDLRDKIRETTGATVTVYTGGSPLKSQPKREWDTEKRENARRFMSNEATVMVATKAFGMGIDKPNVRYTVHFGMPGSLEAFYQEAGRAGRDRKEALSVILYSPSAPDAEKRLLDPNLSLEEVREEHEKVHWDARGDGGAALWFHLNSFSGASAEKEDVKWWLEQIREVADGGFLDLPFPPREEDRSKAEKALFRLVQVGALSDYEVDYGRRLFKVYGGHRDFEKLAQRVLAYVRLSQPARAREMHSKLEKHREVSGNGAVLLATGMLIDFCYDTIERARRRSIFESMAAAKEGLEPNRFRRRLLSYLQEGMDPEGFQDLVSQEQVPFEDCVKLIDKVNNALEADELRGITIRFLESYPDHPGLLLLRAVSEALAEDRDDAVVVESLGALFAWSPERYGVAPDELESVAQHVLSLAETRAEMLAPALVLALRDADTTNGNGSSLADTVMDRARRICPSEMSDLVAIDQLSSLVRRARAELSNWVN